MAAAFYQWGNIHPWRRHWGNCHPWRRHFIYEETVTHWGDILPMKKGHPWRRHFTYEETVTHGGGILPWGMVIHGGGILPLRKRSPMEVAFYLWGNVHPWRRHWSWSRMTGRPPSWAARKSASVPCFLVKKRVSIFFVYDKSISWFFSEVSLILCK